MTVCTKIMFRFVIEVWLGIVELMLSLRTGWPLDNGSLTTVDVLGRVGRKVPSKVDDYRKQNRGTKLKPPGGLQESSEIVSADQQSSLVLDYDGGTHQGRYRQTNRYRFSVPAGIYCQPSVPSLVDHLIHPKRGAELLWWWWWWWWW